MVWWRSCCGLRANGEAPEQEAREGEDACYTSMAISFRYETEVVATLLASWDSDFIHPIEHLEICGSDGEIVVDNVLTRGNAHETR